MDFVTHFPKTPWRHDAVWVIVDRLTKLAHFLAVRMTFTLEEFYRLFLREIVWLHGVSVSIVSDMDLRFTTYFWKSFQKAMGTQFPMSTTFHQQTDGQSKRTIQVLKDMLRACVLDFKGNWEEHYEALYGRPCRSLICWTEMGERSITYPNLIRDTS